MALNLPAGGGENRIPILKYDGKAGRVFRVDRSNDSGSWDSVTTEIPQSQFQAIFDLEHIETGWLSFPTGGAPDIRTHGVGVPLGEKPGDKYRPGFRIYLKLGKSISAPGVEADIREMAANARVSIEGMDELHDAYLKGVKDNPGKLPVVALEKVEPVASSGKDPNGKPVSSTNYRPHWKIVRWVDRPAELTPAALIAMRQPTPAAAGAAAAPAEMADAEEF
jgi:hypothetical protein